MAMKAKRFFAVLSRAQKLHTQKEAANHVALCDIASIGLGDGKYYEEVRKVFYLRAIERQDILSRNNALDPTDEGTVALVTDIFNQAQRFK